MITDSSVKKTGAELAEPASKKRQTPAAWLVACDVLLIGAALCVFALFHHVLPRAYAIATAAAASYSETLATDGAAAAAAPTQTPQAAVASLDHTTTAPAAEATPAAESGAVTAASSDLGGGKFADKFTAGAVLTTDNTYVSENVNVTLTETQVNGVTYYVEDIYIRNIENLRTAFADDTYGRSITEWVLEMAQAHDAIAAINGDYYGINASGVVIRNGKLYSDVVDGEVCVLFYDGTLRVYAAEEFDAEAVMAAGAYQAWSFGPALLSDDGEALTSFSSRISGVNPRTAIGYYEPGHYAFVVVDGRQAGYSNGMTLAQLSALFEQLGCEVAYNLDGGKTSAMTFGDSLTNQPTEGGRTTSDIIYIGE